MMYFSHEFTDPDQVQDMPIGGKAHGLLRLAEAGFDVPPWFVVLPGGSLRSTTVVKACEALTRDPTATFAVRSSAVAEDGTEHSFAGQFDSFLEVSADKVAEHIKKVRKSATSSRVKSYCRERGVELPAAPAVVVQRMVDPIAAGVAFSADPVSGRRDLALVSSVPGLGEALVSGESDADTFSIDSSGSLVQVDFAHDPASIDEATAALVAALARRAESSFGVPQDIEWVLDQNGAVQLVQARPITSLGRVPDPTDPLTIWDNSNIAESYSGVTTPMTFTFASRAYEEVYRQFCRILSVPESRISEADGTFRTMLGLVRGRVYYNLISWYRVLAMLPGFKLNRGFMEGMMGVKEPMPDEVVDRIVGEVSGSKVGDGVSLIRSVFGLIRSQIGLRGQIRRFYERLDSALSSVSQDDLDTMSGDALVSHYRDLERRLLTQWDAPLVNDFFAMIFFGVLGKMTAKHAGDTDGSVRNSLVHVGGDEVISMEPARRLFQLGELCAEAGAVDLFRSQAKPRVLRSEEFPNTPDGWALGDAYDEYLERFGDRCLGELKLESPTLYDDPKSFHHSIAAMADRATTADADSETQDTAVHGEASEDSVSEVLARVPWLHRPVFRWVLKQARSRVRDRENLRFERTRLFGRVRRVLIELGKRLRSDGRLDSERDVFHLELDEVLGLYEGVATSADLRPIVAARREEFRSHEAGEAPPDRFQTRGPLHRVDRFEATSSVNSEPETSGDSSVVRRGIGACSGVVRGLARVVIDPSDADLMPGEILVAQQTDPGWVMLFPLASGLVVERGSLLSHSAIVARELGLPAVVSVSGCATDWLVTGDLIELDGSSGEVRKIGS